MTEKTLNHFTDHEKNLLVEILSEQLYPKSAKELRSLLRKHGLQHPEYLITRALRELIAEDKVRFKGGRWMSPELYDQKSSASTGNVQHPVNGPDLSPVGSPFVGTSTSAKHSGTQSDDAKASEKEMRGPWGTFRRLLKYYRECVRDEEGADASSFLTDIHKQFIFANGTGNWFPKTGKSWNYVIPMGEHIADFQQQVAKNRTDNTIVLGYPIEAVRIEKDEGEFTLIQPVFYFILDAKFTESSISLSTSDAQPEIAPRWMKHALKDYSEQYHFLSACGLLNQPRPDDELAGFTSGDIRPDIDDLVRTLSRFLPRRIREVLNPRSVLPNVLPSGLKTGIYNRAVIMLGSRTKFTQTLLKELTRIEQEPDDILDKTALSFLFKESKGTSQKSNRDDVEHEAVVAETLPLNAEQREATASILNRNLTVTTGPPGTGKSQVVVATIANSHFLDESVLFTSRNHKAIDAVYDRARDTEGNPLLIRANSKGEEAINYSFSNAIKDLLSDTIDTGELKTFKQRKSQLQRLLGERGAIARQATEIQSFRDKIGELHEELAWLNEQLPAQIVSDLNSATIVSDEGRGNKFDREIASIVEQIDNVEGMSLWRWLRFWVRLWPHWRWLKKQLSDISGDFQFSAFPPLKREVLKSFDFSLYHRIVRHVQAQQKLLPLESSLLDLPNLSELSNSLEDLNTKIQSIATEMSSLSLKTKGGLPPESDLRESLDGLRVALTALRNGYNTPEEMREAEKRLESQVPLLLQNFPCWAVTNLSVGSKIPLVPGMYDVAIIDEASQCDIASAIPILFRSKRAGVVGDPHQLRHVSKLNTSKDALFRKRSHLTTLDDQRFAYSETSLYDLFAKTNSVSPLMLRETYRSCSDIAGYSNDTFYGGQLRVATDESMLRVPKGTIAGIHWTEVNGEVVSAGRSGCVSEDEINAIHELVHEMLVENNFQGSIGIVTPFRMQANRLNDRIYSGKIPFALLKGAQIVVDTSHGFQGDEKDVMLFSLCAGPNMPDGSRNFLHEQGNLFNVAVSRARAVLHVVGNRTWAVDSGMSHISRLALKREERTSTPNLGPWSPYESPWEKKLAEALISVGITPTPQLPVAGRRLDLALVDADRGIRIDIEVDGDAYHRNPDGSRKKDDLWRDLTMQGRGWKVMRFWVYQLSERMDKCVAEIETAWRKND